MHSEWPRVSMQPAGASEVHSRKEIRETQRCCRVQLQPVRTTYCAKHKTTVRRPCLPLHYSVREKNYLLLAALLHEDNECHKANLDFIVSILCHG